MLISQRFLATFQNTKKDTWKIQLYKKTTLSDKDPPRNILPT